ncbi:hypothetical protein Glove_169g8 [Diversispora epigaea]|uniref:Uncharacterized protein n=1 Tax=Diversispora epigaea TaxID=1348612 RepID=A0A397IPB6_9GLOM|nr:hypothetical protein Glove_169g8 [Diversispora epigaea]
MTSREFPAELRKFSKNLCGNFFTNGKSSLHPIYVSLGNIPTWRRNKEDAKQLLGYLPILSAKNEKEKKSSEFKELARETFHNSIKFLLDPLFQGDGVDFNIDDKDIWFFPRISTIICDWPEACTFSLTYKSANSNYPCHFCLVQREDLIDIRKEVILRNHVNMKEYFDSNTSNLAGLEQVNNYFWSIPNLNIYAATVPDRMHHLDLGLFKYQIEFTMELLKKKKSLNKVNERIADIPRHSQLKGKSSLHPIYVSLGNIPTWRRNKEDAKQLLGYLPILSAKNEKEKKSSEFKELARETFHNSIKFLLDPLFQGDGVDFNIDDKDIWFFPRISTIICDWPEACTFSLTYKSANSNYPCHFCLVQREDLIDIRKEVILRNHVNMKEYFDSNTSKLAGLEQVNNYFWSIPNLNIYAATVPDRMHHLDLGLFKYQIEFTMELLKKKKSLNKVNERIADIPRHSQLKVFKKGIQLSRLTASEYRDMMKIIVFVVDDLQIEDLSKVYVKWNEMYLLSRSEKFKESDLKNFQKAINDCGNLFIKLFQNISNSHLKFPKLHSWIYHIVDTIREYGAINGYTTETYESLHKTYMKIPYRFTIVSRNRVGKTKTPMAFVYTAKLFDFDLSESIIEQNKKDPNLDKKMIKDFEKFIDCLKVYLNILNIISAEGCRIKIYNSVTLKNGAILRTKNDFHHKPWFSNIATLLITEIRLPNKSPMHLALVQWYDFIEEIPFVYGCPLLRLVEVYNFIEIEVIEDTIHVVPRFDKNNEYFVI